MPVIQIFTDMKIDHCSVTYPTMKHHAAVDMNKLQLYASTQTTLKLSTEQNMPTTGKCMV